MISYFLNSDYESLMIQLLIVFFSWIIVLFSIGIDLHFGIKKSKEKGIFKTHSFGLRKTSEKTVEYLAFMFFMLFLDFLNPLFVYFAITPLPLLSLFGAIVLVYTEWKSVKEKSDEKFRHVIQNNPQEIINFIKTNRDLINEIQSKL